MFKELLPLLRKGDTLLLTIGRTDEGEKLHVGVTPQLAVTGEPARAINRPIQITADAGELDAELHTFLGAHAAKLAGARTVFGELDAQLKAAEEEARKAVVAARSKGAKPAPEKTPAAEAPAAAKVELTADDLQPALF